jgi:hypothetical protein
MGLADVAEKRALGVAMAMACRISAHRRHLARQGGRKFALNEVLILHFPTSKSMPYT